jgi:hypothetical protein
LDKTDGNRQNPYTEALKKSPGGGKGYHNPYEWKKPNQPKKAKLQGQRKGYNV